MASTDTSLQRIARLLEAQPADPNAAEREQREKDDLQAQQLMARWAWWLLVVSAVQAGVGALGFVALIVTIRQTGKAYRLARENAHAEMRAYVHAERATLEWGGDKGQAPRITIWARNTGQTPARWFGASCKVFCTDPGESLGKDGFDSVDLSDRPLIAWPALAGQGSELSFPGVKDGDWDALRDAFDNRRTLNVVGIVRYETLFGEIYESQFWFTRRAPHRPRYEPQTSESIGLATYGVRAEIPLSMPRAPVALSTYRPITVGQIRTRQRFWSRGA